MKFGLTCLSSQISSTLHISRWSLRHSSIILFWVNLSHHWHLAKSGSTQFGQAKGKETITEFWRWKQAKISTRCLASNKSVQMTSFSRSPKNITFVVLILPISPKLSRFLYKAPSIDQVSDLVLCHGTSKKAKIFDFLTEYGNNVFLIFLSSLSNNSNCSVISKNLICENKMKQNITSQSYKRENPSKSKSSLV